MSANNDPIFISSPLHWDAVLSAEIFPRAGGAIAGNLPVLLGVAGDYGGVITSINVQATGNVAANVCVIFSQKDGDTLVKKRCEIALPAVAGASNTAAIASVDFVLPDKEPFEGGVVQLLKLGAKESLYAALLVAEATSKFNIHAVGGLYDQA